MVGDFVFGPGFYIDYVSFLGCQSSEEGAGNFTLLVCLVLCVYLCLCSIYLLEI